MIYDGGGASNISSGCLLKYLAQTSHNLTLLLTTIHLLQKYNLVIKQLELQLNTSFFLMNNLFPRNLNFCVGVTEGGLCGSSSIVFYKGQPHHGKVV